MENVKSVCVNGKWNASDYCGEIQYRVISPKEIEVFLEGSLRPQLDGKPSATIYIRHSDGETNCVLGINELEDGFSTDDMLKIGVMMKKIESNYSEIHESMMSRLDFLLQDAKE